MCFICFVAWIWFIYLDFCHRLGHFQVCYSFVCHLDLSFMREHLSVTVPFSGVLLYFGILSVMCVQCLHSWQLLYHFLLCCFVVLQFESDLYAWTLCCLLHHFGVCGWINFFKSEIDLYASACCVLCVKLIQNTSALFSMIRTFCILLADWLSKYWTL